MAKEKSHPDSELSEELKQKVNEMMDLLAAKQAKAGVQALALTPVCNNPAELNRIRGVIKKKYGLLFTDYEIVQAINQCCAAGVANSFGLLACASKRLEATRP